MALIIPFHIASRHATPNTSENSKYKYNIPAKITFLTSWLLSVVQCKLCFSLSRKDFLLHWQSNCRHFNLIMNNLIRRKLFLEYKQHSAYKYIHITLHSYNQQQNKYIFTNPYCTLAFQMSLKYLHRYIISRILVLFYSNMAQNLK